MLVKQPTVLLDPKRAAWLALDRKSSAAVPFAGGLGDAADFPPVTTWRCCECLRSLAAARRKPSSSSENRSLSPTLSTLRSWLSGLFPTVPGNSGEMLIGTVRLGSFSASDVKAAQDTPVPMLFCALGADMPFLRFRAAMTTFLTDGRVAGLPSLSLLPMESDRFVFVAKDIDDSAPATSVTVRIWRAALGVRNAGGRRARSLINISKIRLQWRISSSKGRSLGSSPNGCSISTDK
mmetsp:Transcript_69213/g.200494  ORF Transcript_69213/g.200494 Transcript_69213/m.200494 type:complete len:236 (+) Transcript_69213:270-977(+)